MLVRLTDHLTIGLVERIALLTCLIYVGCYVLQNESINEFFQDYHGDKGESEGVARSVEKKNSVALLAHAKS